MPIFPMYGSYFYVSLKSTLSSPEKFSTEAWLFLAPRMVCENEWLIENENNLYELKQNLNDLLGLNILYLTSICQPSF
jgi:hypothetical protein